MPHPAEHPSENLPNVLAITLPGQPRLFKLLRPFLTREIEFYASGGTRVCPSEPSTVKASFQVGNWTYAGG